MRLFERLIVVLALVTGAPLIETSYAEWSDDTSVRTPVATAENRQYHPRLTTASKGFVITWKDLRRENTHIDVYAQKLNINGEKLWLANGRIIAAGPENSLVYQNQLNAGLAHDGEGGALIAWNDTNNAGYSQAFITRAASDSTVSWGDPGESIQSGDTAAPMLANPTRGANILFS